MRVTAILLLSVLLGACNSKLSKESTAVGSVDLNYRIQSATKYRMSHRNETSFNDIPAIIESESLLAVRSLDDIQVNILSSEQIILDEELKQTVVEMLSLAEVSNDGPLYCYSKDGKEIVAKEDSNDEADLKTIGTMMTWNSQSKLPSSKMQIGDVIEVGDSNRSGSSNTVTKYTLDKIEDNIAYLSYEAKTVYKKDNMRMNMNLGGNMTSTGELEYDVLNSFYRLITREENSSMSGQFKSPNEKLMKSSEGKFSMKSKTTSTIAIVQ